MAKLILSMSGWDLVCHEKAHEKYAHELILEGTHHTNFPTDKIPTSSFLTSWEALLTRI